MSDGPPCPPFPVGPEAEFYGAPARTMPGRPITDAEAERLFAKADAQDARAVGPEARRPGAEGIRVLDPASAASDEEVQSAAAAAMLGGAVLLAARAQHAGALKKIGADPECRLSDVVMAAARTSLAEAGICVPAAAGSPGVYVVVVRANDGTSGIQIHATLGGAIAGVLGMLGREATDEDRADLAAAATEDSVRSVGKYPTVPISGDSTATIAWEELLG